MFNFENFLPLFRDVTTWYQSLDFGVLSQRNHHRVRIRV